jgi:FemAB-related protein (PEP-CTERM system-associated)
MTQILPRGSAGVETPASVRPTGGPQTLAEFGTGTQDNITCVTLTDVVAAAYRAPEPAVAAPDLAVHVRAGRELDERLPDLERYVARGGVVPLSRHPAWLRILRRGLGHVPYCLEAVADGQTRGLLCLAYVRSLLFGRFLVSLPYLNYGGVLADDEATSRLLIDGAAALADQLKVRYLEVRHETAVAHPRLPHKATTKVNMRLALPGQLGQLWDRLPAKVRNQVRKGQKSGLTVHWGGQELLADFYHVFSHNMRDLGTPVYSRRLFRSVLEQFPDRAEICSVRLGKQPAAAAILLHGWGVTEVPSASSLRSHNHTCANMLMYWHLLERAVERKNEVFDFGRCSPDGNTFRFKKQWGAEPAYTEWQYYLRYGKIGELNPYSSRYQGYVRRWQRLPVWLTRLIGPLIVRGIP